MTFPQPERKSPGPRLRGDDGRYAVLRTEADEPLLLLQKVGHESRIYLDIETDDIEAEADRLEKLGAKRIDFVRN